MQWELEEGRRRRRGGATAAHAARLVTPPHPAPPHAAAAEGLILPEAYAAHVRCWVQGGASVVGGCCGVGPTHIRLLRQMADGGLLAAAAAV